MPKRRSIQGQPKEILHFFIANFKARAEEDEFLISTIREGFAGLGMSVLEHNIEGGNLAVINESEFEVKKPEIYRVLDNLNLEASYASSEFV